MLQVKFESDYLSQTLNSRVLESFPMMWSTFTYALQKYALQRYAGTVGSICGTQKVVALIINLIKF